MSDIVKQLLSRSSNEAGIGWTPTTVVHVPAGLLHQAADQITALRTENEKLKSALQAVRFNLLQAGYKPASIMVEGIDAALGGKDE